MIPFLLEPIGVGTAAFLATNIDDVFLLVVWFADPGLRPRHIVAGQFLGIAALIALSVAGAMTARLIPAAWLGLLGLFPLVLGVRVLLAARRDEHDEAGENKKEEATADRLTRGRTTRGWPVIGAVAAITIANGGDNIGVYVPLFAAHRPAQAIILAAVFLVLTGFLCVLAYAAVRLPLLGTTFRRAGHAALPWVLIFLGLYLLVKPYL